MEKKTAEEIVANWESNKDSVYSRILPYFRQFVKAAIGQLCFLVAIAEERSDVPASEHERLDNLVAERKRQMGYFVELLRGKTVSEVIAETGVELDGAYATILHNLGNLARNLLLFYSAELESHPSIAEWWIEEEAKSHSQVRQNKEEVERAKKSALESVRQILSEFEQ